MHKKATRKEDFGKENSTRNQKVSGCGGFVHMENGRTYKRTVLRSAATPPPTSAEVDVLLEEFDDQPETKEK